MGKWFVFILIFIILAAPFLLMVKPASAVSEDSWTSKAPMHQARLRLGIAVVNEKIYAIGGDDLSLMGNVLSPEMGYGQVLSINEEYDPTTDTWTFKTSCRLLEPLLGLPFTKIKSIV